MADTPIAGTKPDTFGREAAQRTMREAAEAAKVGVPMTAVPYDGESDDPVERARAQAWLRGWMRGTQALNRRNRSSPPSPGAVTARH